MKNYPLIENADEILKEICLKGINAQYGEKSRKTSESIVEKELESGADEEPS